MNKSLIVELAKLIDERNSLPDEPHPPYSYKSKQWANGDIGNWAINNADEILARLRVTDAIINGQGYTHATRGSTYTKLAIGTAQTTNPISDNEKLVAYLDKNGEYWFRPITEFEDGRFQEITHG